MGDSTGGESALRRVENTSVSRLPAEEHEQAMLAKRLGFASVDDFLGEYQLATRNVQYGHTPV